MALTPEEFARLERVRTSIQRTAKSEDKRSLQLAFEHIEALSEQHQKLIAICDALVDIRRKSLCFRIPQFFYLQWARVKRLFA